MDRKETKRQRNRQYYLKHRSERQAKARAYYHEHKRHTKASKRSILQSILEPLALACLILTSTYFLLTEAVRFLAQCDSLGSSWLKALIGEGMILTLSWAQAKTPTTQFFRCTLLALLFVYNGYITIGGVISNGVNRSIASEVAHTQVKEIESVISQKQGFLIEARKLDRLTLSRRYERELTVLREDLKNARAEMLKNPQDRLKTFSALAFFRLLVLACNSYLVSQLSVSIRGRKLNT